MPRFDIRFTNWSKKTASSNKIEFDKDDCTDEEIGACLTQTQHDCCHLNLEYFFEEESTSLTLDSKNGEYRLLYFDSRDFDEDGYPHYNIKAYYDPHRPKKMVDFAGEEISNRFIFNDFNIVKELFKQFIENKTVSDDLLNN